MPRSMSDSGLKRLCRAPAAFLSLNMNVEDEAVDDSTDHGGLNDRGTNSTTDTSKGKVNQSIDDTFILFPKLPIEIRLKIWGHAAPEGYVVVQTDGFGTKDKYIISRPVPALLHTCQESRLEYLESGSEPEGGQSHVRKRGHPVYKLLFRDDPAFCSPAFFSSDIDTFFGEMTLGNKEEVRSGILSHDKSCAGFMVSEVSSTVEQLVIRQPGYNNSSAEFFSKTFPKLRTLTILIDLCEWKLVTKNSKRYITRQQLPATPEVNGELNLYDSQLDLRKAREVKGIQNLFADARIQHPDWNSPVLKVRSLAQFIETENINPNPFRASLWPLSMCVD